MCGQTHYTWYPSTCTCGNGKHLESIISDSLTTCDRIIELTKTVPTKTVLAKIVPTRTIPPKSTPSKIFITKAIPKYFNGNNFYYHITRPVTNCKKFELFIKFTNKY